MSPLILLVILVGQVLYSTRTIHVTPATEEAPDSYYFVLRSLHIQVARVSEGGSRPRTQVMLSFLLPKVACGRGVPGPSSLVCVYYTIGTRVRE